MGGVDLSFLRSNVFQQNNFILTADGTEQGNQPLNIKSNYLTVQFYNPSANDSDYTINVLVNGFVLIPNIAAESVNGPSADMKTINFKVELEVGDLISFSGVATIPTDTIQVNWIVSGI